MSERTTTDSKMRADETRERVGGWSAQAENLEAAFTEIVEILPRIRRILANLNREVRVQVEKVMTDLVGQDGFSIDEKGTVPTTSGITTRVKFTDEAIAELYQGSLAVDEAQRNEAIIARRYELRDQISQELGFPVETPLSTLPPTPNGWRDDVYMSITLEYDDLVDRLGLEALQDGIAQAVLRMIINQETITTAR